MPPVERSLLAMLEKQGCCVIRGDQIETTLYLDNDPLYDRLSSISSSWNELISRRPNLAPHVRRCCACASKLCPTF